MKKKILLPILLLATLSLGGGLVACNPAGGSSSGVVSAYKVAIDNKAALEGEWYEGDAKDLELTLTPEANALQELQNKNLTVTSSDETVVKVTGLGLTALKEGTAKITVDYRGAKEEVNVTILSKSAKKKYGAAHEGTAEDPFTNEDALLVAKSEKYGGEVYYVKGIVASFYNAPGSRDDGMVAYFLTPATEGGEKFEIYKCFKENNGKLTDDDIWVGGEATAYGAFTKYNNQYETSSATFVKCEGNKPQPRQTLTKTFAETLAAGVALADGDQTWDYYKFQAYVTVKAGNDYYLTATKGEALVAGKSDEAHGAKDIKGTNAIELYGAGKVAEVAAKLLEGAKVEVTMIVKNYHGTVENGLALADADVTVLEAGTAWAVPEPAVANKTVTEFVALENNKKNAYVVKANIKAWKGEAADQYGNMTITDGTTDLVIYGCSATATALAWDGAGEYAFTNPKDFLTNDVTKALKVGDEITMKLIRADYTNSSNVTTIQGTGIITAVTAPDTPAVVSLAKYTFTTQTANNTRSIDAAGVNALFTKAEGEALYKEAKTVENVYEGANGGSGDTAWTLFNILKIGKSKTAGKLVFELEKEVSKIVVKGGAWTATASVTVNGVAVAEAFKDNIVKKDAIADGKLSNPGTLEFEFAASKEITIEVGNTNSNANFGVVFTEMEFFGQEAAGGEHEHAWVVGDKAADSALRPVSCTCAETGYELQAADLTDGQKAPSTSDKNTRLGKNNKFDDVWNVTGIAAGTYDLYLNAQTSQYNAAAYWNAGTAQEHGDSASNNGNSTDFRYKVKVDGGEYVNLGSATDEELDQFSDFGLEDTTGAAKWTTKPVARITVAEGATSITIHNMNNGYAIWIFAARLMKVAA